MFTFHICKYKNIIFKKPKHDGFKEDLHLGNNNSTTANPVVFLYACIYIYVCVCACVYVYIFLFLTFFPKQKNEKTENDIPNLLNMAGLVLSKSTYSWMCILIVSVAFSGLLKKRKKVLKTLCIQLLDYSKQMLMLLFCFFENVSSRFLFSFSWPAFYSFCFIFFFFRFGFF